MFDESLLPKVKGAPISILLLLSISGNRTMTIGEIKKKTGYSDKTTKAGLMKLRDLGMVTETQPYRYQLTGNEYQLPLYWDEKIEANGIISEPSGFFPDIERRIAALEDAVFRGLPESEAGDFPIYDGDFPEPETEPATRAEMYSGNFPEKYGISPNEAGDFPLIEIDGCWKDSEGYDPSEMYSGNFSEKYGNFPEDPGEIPNQVINNINNIQAEEVSKYEETESTYLPENKNTAVNQLPQQEEIPETVRNFWKAAMLQMQGNMGQATYKTYLASAVIIGYEDGHYTIAIENKMKRDWCHDRLTISLEKVLTGMSGEKCSVSFVFDQAAIPQKEPSAAVRETMYEAPSLELLPGSGELIGICNDYLLDPTGIDYSKKQLQELISMEPDPEVLQYILPRAKRFEIAKNCCSKSFSQAKEGRLTHYGLTGKAVEDLAKDKRVSLEMIDEECERVISQLGKQNIGAAYRKIMALIKAETLEL